MDVYYAYQRCYYKCMYIARIYFGLARAILGHMNAESAASCREREALERTFQRFRLKIGPRTWRRADLHARS